MTELEARLMASRGAVPAPLDLPRLLSTAMAGLPAGAARVKAAIKAKQCMVVVADYDCDGATSCAVAVAGLRALGGQVSYVVPDRMVHGYGIAPSVVDLALERCPEAKLLITVDNGILGHAGIAHAAHLGLDVVVTDHHLPGKTLPEATAIINPARGDCPSGMRELAGVGVALFLVLAVKRLLAADGVDTPAMNFLLPHVAVGAVADMVPLGPANRQLVSVGLDRMRAGLQVPVGLAALIREAGIHQAYLTTQDIGFALGPRINAAGRLASMETGIELLLATDPAVAKRLARQLTETNDERKRLQREATADAAMALDITFHADSRAIVHGDAAWHPGIVGLVASRLKEKFHRPTFVFSLMDGLAKGSGRSIPGFHLKDALEEVARRFPGLLCKFGGHAMAAGATLTSPEALETFGDALALVARQRITDEMLNNILLSDGPMPDLTLDAAARVMRHPWGQHFEAPAFDDGAVIDEIKPMGKDGLHWRIDARVGGRRARTQIVLFNQPEPPQGQEVRLFLQPGLNTWLDRTSVQWTGRVLH